MAKGNGYGNGSGNGHFTPLRNGHDHPDPIPPHDHLEQSLLAALLVDNRRLADVGTLQPEHFGYAVHGRIFSLISRLITDNLPANPDTMTYMVAGDPALTTRIEYLRGLAESVVTYTPLAVSYYADELIALSAQRSLMALGEDLSRIFLDPNQASFVDRVDAVWDEMDTLRSKWKRDRSPTSPLSSLNYLKLDDDIQANRRWLVQDWLPMGETCGLGGSGGEGKTLLVHQLATCAALGFGDWVGMRVTQMKAALLLCEDNANDAHWRQIKINKLYRCSMADLHGELLTIPRREADSNYLAVFDKSNEMTLTPLFHQLLNEFKEFGAKLVVLDTLFDVFNGEQNNPIHARKFIRGCCDRIARELDGIVILVFHPSIRGMSEGDYQSGSVQWNSGYRARLGLTRPEGGNKEDDDTDDTRVLKLFKTNLGPPTEALKINWQAGAFVRKQPPVDDLVQFNAETSKAQRVFMQLLDEYNASNRFVSNNSARRNFAPLMFAQDAAREGCTKKQFDRAMATLFARKEITNETYSIPSRGLTRIIRRVE